MRAAISSVEISSQRFGPLTVEYDARVLTPRPWTLMQSFWAAELSASAGAGPLLELCAGAGHIGLAAAAFTGRALVQVEADPVAAGYARRNAARAGLGSQVEIRCDRMQTAIATDERFPIVLADPPYLPSADVGRWPEDPSSAIDGGADGLELLRVCLQLASQHATPGGALLLQVAGETQARDIGDIVAGADHLGMEVRETRSHDSARAVMLLTRSR